MDYTPTNPTMTTNLKKSNQRKNTLTPQRKENSLTSYNMGIALKLKKYRKRIETAIRAIILLMPRWIRAITEHVFEM